MFIWTLYIFSNYRIIKWHGYLRFRWAKPKDLWARPSRSSGSQTERSSPGWAACRWNMGGQMWQKDGGKPGENHMKPSQVLGKTSTFRDKMTWRYLKYSGFCTRRKRRVLIPVWMDVLILYNILYIYNIHARLYNSLYMSLTCLVPCVSDTAFAVAMKGSHLGWHWGRRHQEVAPMGPTVCGEAEAVSGFEQPLSSPGFDFPQYTFEEFPCCSARICSAV